MPRLTDRTVKAAKAGAKYREIPDETRGLVLRLYPSGAKAWGYRYRIDGKSKRLSIGDYPGVSLAEAREIATDHRKLVKRGIDPGAKPEERMVYTFGKALDAWGAFKEGQGNVSVAATRAIIEKHALERLGEIPVDAIGRRQVHSLLCQLRDEKGLGPQVNRVQSALSSVLSYCVDSGHLEVNPIRGMKRLIGETERERVLSLPELAAVWKASFDLKSTLGPIVRFLILVPLRKREVSQTRWRDLDLDKGLLRLSRDRVKSKVSRDVPLSDAALDLIKEQPRFSDDAHVFSSRSGAEFDSWDDALKRLRALSGLGEHWNLHDLRRSLRTHISEELAVAEPVGQALTGHSRKTRLGQGAVYDRSTRLPQQRDALNRWANFFLGRLNTRADRVVPLKAASANK